MLIENIGSIASNKQAIIFSFNLIKLQKYIIAVRKLYTNRPRLFFDG